MSGYPHFEIRFIIQKVRLFVLMSLYFGITVFMQSFKQLQLEIYHFLLLLLLLLLFIFTFPCGQQTRSQATFVVSSNRDTDSPRLIIYYLSYQFHMPHYKTNGQKSIMLLRCFTGVEKLWVCISSSSNFFFIFFLCIFIFWGINHLLLLHFYLIVLEYGWCSLFIHTSVC